MSPARQPAPSSTAIRRAVIDVGTNSVKLLVAEVTGSSLQPVDEASAVTRLGRGFYQSHVLQPDAIADTAGVVGEFARRARAHGARFVRVIATSAARDAGNASALVEAIQRASGHAVEIISGDQEADWVFRGVTTDGRLAGGALLIMDVGGGSTEFIIGEHGHCQFRRSFQLGVVRELEHLKPPDPPAAGDLESCRRHVRRFLQAHVVLPLRDELARHNHGRLTMVGVGGSATVLAAMQMQLREFDRDRLDGFRLSLEDVRRRTDELWSLPLVERQRLPGLPPNRADVILAGSAIYEAVMEAFGFSECRVSTRGLRYAAALEDQ